MNRQAHWNHVYQNKDADQVSWYQPRPVLSLALIAAAQIEKDGGILDVGGGASELVDYLLDLDYSNLAVLDLSSVALQHSRSRLGIKANAVKWFEQDVTTFESPYQFALWHDRAVFHFLTHEKDRHAYVTNLKRTLKPHGSVIIATFALDGGKQCSGLEVVRYDEETMLNALGAEFELLDVQRETHITPWQTTQFFIYFRFQFTPS